MSDKCKDPPSKKTLLDTAVPLAGGVAGAIGAYLLPFDQRGRMIAFATLSSTGGLIGEAIVTQKSQYSSYAGYALGGGAAGLGSYLVGMDTKIQVAAAAAGAVVVGPVLGGVLRPTGGILGSLFSIVDSIFGIGENVVKGVECIGEGIHDWAKCNPDDKIDDRCACYKQKYPKHKILYWSGTGSAATDSGGIAEGGYINGPGQCWIADCSKSLADRKATGFSMPACSMNKQLDEFNAKTPNACVCKLGPDFHDGRAWVVKKGEAVNAGGSLAKVKEDAIMCRYAGRNASKGYASYRPPCTPKQTRDWLNMELGILTTTYGDDDKARQAHIDSFFDPTLKDTLRKEWPDYVHRHPYTKKQQEEAKEWRDKQGGPVLWKPVTLSPIGKPIATTPSPISSDPQGQGSGALQSLDPIEGSYKNKDRLACVCYIKDPSQDIRPYNGQCAHLLSSGKWTAWRGKQCSVASQEAWWKAELEYIYGFAKGRPDLLMKHAERFPNPVVKNELIQRYVLFERQKSGGHN